MGATIDLNCDLGEGAGRDEELMPLITSANIACGAHAGGEATMRATLALARRYGVAAGAHPGFEDRAHFGRRELALTPAQIETMVRAQLETLKALAAAEGVTLRHVKPHGALYNLAARDRATADAIAWAVASVESTWVLVGLAGSALLAAGAAAGLRVASEVFADRTYRADGALTPRSEPGALIEDKARAVAQVVRMVREGRVRALDGCDVAVRADTVCVHGDGAHAVGFARRLRAALEAEGVAVTSLV